MTKAKARTVEEYMALPYRRELIHDDGAVVARIIELPFCVTQGATEEEALEQLRDAMEGWLEVSLECGDEIPLPLSMTEVSGVTNVRLGKALHRRLKEQAERNGVSLNTYIIGILEQGTTEHRMIEEFKSAVGESVAIAMSAVAFVTPMESESRIVWGPTDQDGMEN